MAASKLQISPFSGASLDSGVAARLAAGDSVVVLIKKLSRDTRRTRKIKSADLPARHFWRRSGSYLEVKTFSAIYRGGTSGMKPTREACVSRPDKTASKDI